MTLGSRPAAVLPPERKHFALLRGIASPRALALFCIVLLTLSGWVYIALGIATPVAEGRLAALGPGMGALAWLVGPGAEAPRWLQILCTAPFPGASAQVVTLGGLALTFAMWTAMALAMMMPTAAPMLMTYAELAETAGRRRQPVVSPWVLAAGYLTAWCGFAVLATVLSVALTAGGWLDAAMAPMGAAGAAAVFAGAGLYQFSPLKAACLTACQSPFRFFFANWTDTRQGVFRLGVRQGLFCLGCCWAVMLVMFAVGLMNVLWMAALGGAMALEKVVPGNAVRRTVGVALLTIAAGLLVSHSMRLLS